MESSNVILQFPAVRQIWSQADVILCIFAGASAEFALNKEVDWLYVTGKLPADPIGRLFSTVAYAQEMIFSDRQHAQAAIHRINAIHHGVEGIRKKEIPSHAYRDVLYLLIHYSVTAFEWLERKLTDEEKEELIRTFRDIGEAMHIGQLPGSYVDWRSDYDVHMQRDLEYSHFTKDLFRQYRKHLGPFRYFILLEVQRRLAPAFVNTMLELGKPRMIHWLVFVYKPFRKSVLSKWLIPLLAPAKFKHPIKRLNRKMI